MLSALSDRLQTLGSVLALGTVVLTLAAAPAQALDSVEWDQEAVAAAAARFSEKVSGLKLEMRAKQLETSETAMLRHTSHLIGEEMRLIDRRARALAKQLQDGADQASTEPIFRRLVSHIRNIQVDIRNWPPLQDLGPKISEARKDLEALAAYYGTELPPPLDVAAPRE